MNNELIKWTSQSSSLLLLLGSSISRNPHASMCFPNMSLSASYFLEQLEALSGMSLSWLLLLHSTSCRWARNISLAIVSLLHPCQLGCLWMAVHGQPLVPQAVQVHFHVAHFRTWLNCYFTELLLYWTVTLRNCYFTELLLDELLIYWTVIWLSCYFTELLIYCYFTVTFTEFFAFFKISITGKFLTPKLPLVTFTVRIPYKNHKDTTRTMPLTIICYSLKKLNNPTVHPGMWKAFALNVEKLETFYKKYRFLGLGKSKICRF